MPPRKYPRECLSCARHSEPPTCINSYTCRTLHTLSIHSPLPPRHLNGRRQLDVFGLYGLSLFQSGYFISSHHHYKISKFFYETIKFPEIFTIFQNVTIWPSLCHCDTIAALKVLKATRTMLKINLRPLCVPLARRYPLYLIRFLTFHCIT